MDNLVRILKGLQGGYAYLHGRYPTDAGSCSPGCPACAGAKRITDLESLAREAEDILGEIDGDDSLLDIGGWRRRYRELGLLPKGGNDSE